MAKIQVMISSRVSDKLPVSKNSKNKVSLGEVRAKLKLAIENFEVLGEKLFEVWMHEDPPKGEGGDKIWDDCIQRSKDIDIFIALYNGVAGHTKDKGGIGLCHAELETACSSGAAKVKVIQLPISSSNLSTDLQFRQYYQDSQIFRFREVSCGDEIELAVRDALCDLLIKLAKLGGREARKSKYDTGDALTWSKISYVDRKNIIEKVVIDSLIENYKGVLRDNNIVSFEIDKNNLNVAVTGMPSNYSISKAKELTGKPFLRDHIDKVPNNNELGPVHIIGCYKNFSENQVISIIGEPDVVIVKSAFGFYVYDPVFFTQIVFITNCRDNSSTRHGMQRFYSWLAETQELRSILKRAKNRKEVVSLLNKLKGRL